MKMRALLAGCLALAVITFPKLHAEETEEPKLKLSIESVQADGNLKIGLHNNSSKKINVWVGCHSWAYFNWRVVTIRGDETRLYCPDPNEEFTVNFPQCQVIDPKGMITEELWLGGQNWKDGVWVGEGKDVRPLMKLSGPKDTLPMLKSGDKIIVIFDVRWSSEANQYDVWTGVAETNAIFHPK